MATKKKMDFDRSKPTIVVENKSTLVTDAFVKRMIAGLQAQIDEDFFPAWGLTARLVFKAAPPFEHMGLVIKDSSDEAGDLGYHFREGYPVAYVFAKDSMSDGAGIGGLTSTVSHEILEMIADPGVNLLAAQPPPEKSRRATRLFSYEVCDPVEANSYRKKGVSVSNFVLPEWFEPEHKPREMKMDFLGVVDSPFELAPGGYVDMFKNGKWKTLWGPEAKKKPASARHRLNARKAKRSVTRTSANS